MNEGVIVFVLLAFLSIVFNGCLERRVRNNLRRYRDRRCTGAAWRRAFPDPPRQDIRKFLSLFAQSLEVRGTPILSFAPGDRIIDVYNAVNPVEGWPDAFELETFARELAREYVLDLEDIWHADLTLGEVFERARKSARVLEV
jgi:hypothetical protein